MAGDVRQGKKDQLHNFQPVAVADYTFLSVENNAALFCRDSSCASLSRARCPLVLRKYSCCETMVLFVSEKSAFHLQDLGLHPVGTSVFSFPTYFLKFTSTCLFRLVGERSKNKTHLHSSNLWGLGVKSSCWCWKELYWKKPKKSYCVWFRLYCCVILQIFDGDPKPSN